VKALESEEGYRALAGAFLQNEKPPEWLFWHSSKAPRTEKTRENDKNQMKQWPRD
jgi:hypothetical protein